MKSLIKNNTKLLSVENVSKLYGKQKANDNISLSSGEGEIVGLLGPNGAGKTTLIRICAGMLRPDSGKVIINNLEQSSGNLETRKQFGIVSNDVTFNNNLTVIETLQLISVLYGLKRKLIKNICEEAIETYHLSEFIKKRMGALSTGMRQRVAIACSLLHKPSLLLLDEPTLGLDPEMRRHIWQYLKALKTKGVTILLTTHYFEEVSNLCTSVHLLLNGAIAMSLNPNLENSSVEKLESEYLKAVNQHNLKI